MPKATLDRFEQRKLTRAKLIDAALKLFSTSGYEHATVDDISREAGYSKGAYYFHFSTKDDILMELLRMWTEDRTTVLAAAEGEATSADALGDVLARFFTYDEQPRWPAVLLEFWAQAVRNAEVSKRLTQAYATWRGQLATAFAQAADVGAIGLESAQDAAAVALAAHDGYAVQVAITPSGGRTPMTASDLAASIVAPLTAERVAERRAAAR
ncbi:MAG TPA: TetR/AcrR family transcriptional regulator [Dehalococcoidia bacterium]|jgi:AcrR family transcriptional regulator|nr:TetR/AcrR family transcriptional regulator [Dehalococcoidia bacterium]